MKLQILLLFVILGQFSGSKLDAQQIDLEVPFRQSVGRPLNFEVVSAINGFSDSLRKVDKHSVLDFSSEKLGYGSDVIFFLLPTWSDVSLVPKADGIEAILADVSQTSDNKTLVVHAIALEDERGHRDVLLMFFNLAQFKDVTIDCLAERALMKLRTGPLAPLPNLNHCT